MTASSDLPIAPQGPPELSLDDRAIRRSVREGGHRAILPRPGAVHRRALDNAEEVEEAFDRSALGRLNRDGNGLLGAATGSAPARRHDDEGGLTGFDEADLPGTLFDVVGILEASDAILEIGVHPFERV